MKNLSIIITGTLFFAIACYQTAFCAQANPFAQAQGEMQQAEKELQKAAQDFTQENEQNPVQQNGQTSWSQATSGPQQTPAPMQAPDPRTQPLQGSPETGYAGTWTDPANGDIVTTVIAPTPPQNQQTQNYPIIIEPQVNGYGGYANQPVITPGLNQWPTTPDNPGYPIPQPPYNPPPQPGWHPYYPGQPYPGFNPYPYPFPQPYPGYNNPAAIAPLPPLPPGTPGATPPPFNPNYKPLRPNNPGSIWQPGMGWGTATPSPLPPGAARTGQSQATQPALPMAPAGQSWHRSPFSPQSPSNGLFGTGNSGRGKF